MRYLLLAFVFALGLFVGAVSRADRPRDTGATALAPAAAVDAPALFGD